MSPSPATPSTKGPFPAPRALQGRVPHPPWLPPARSPGRSAGLARKCPSPPAGSSGEAPGTRPPRDPAGSPRSAPSERDGAGGGGPPSFPVPPPATPSVAVPNPRRGSGRGNTLRRPRGAGTPGPLAHRRSPARSAPAAAPQETLTPAHGYRSALFLGNKARPRPELQVLSHSSSVCFRTFLRAAPAGPRALSGAGQGRDGTGLAGRGAVPPRRAVRRARPRSALEASPDYFVGPGSGRAYIPARRPASE